MEVLPVAGSHTIPLQIQEAISGVPETGSYLTTLFSREYLYQNGSSLTAKMAKNRYYSGGRLWR